MEKIEKRIFTLRKIYLALFLIGVFALVFKIALYEAGEFGVVGELVIRIVIFGVIYTGLKISGKWVIPLILISSAYGLFISFCTILSPAYDFKALMVKILGILYLLFYVYQLKFFSSQDVKNYYGVKGRIFF